MGLAWLAVVLLAGCAARNAHQEAPLKSALDGKRVVVFPFQDPSYTGRQLEGVGGPFATVVIATLQAAGVAAEPQKGTGFSSPGSRDLGTAGTYAADHRYDTYSTGVVTEGIEGATQGSGTVDVAALSVTVYPSPACQPIGAASGRENGQWFTFVNAPTTRFIEPLSDAVVSALRNRTPAR